MTEIKVDPDQLKELADGIQKSEDKVDDALGKLSWTFSSFLVGITQANTGRIKDVQAELEHHMKKYQSKLDELQEGVMLTRAQILEADKNGWDKTGEFGLELLGVYDAERIFAEYDPVTGKKITGWQRAMATGMTLATLFPPAKGVLLLGKMGVKGLKALKLIENGAEVIKQTKNVLNPAVLKKMAQASYNTVIKGPIAKTSAYLKQTAENVKNIELSLNFNVFGHLNRFDPVLENVGQVPGKTVGEITEGIGKSAREMVGKAKDTIVRFSGKGKSTDNGVSKDEYKKLRKKTPSNDVRKMVNPDGPKVDPVYGYEIDKFEADHIVPMKQITEMDGFSKMTREQQIEILNLKDNFVGLGKSSNASKGAHSWADWKGHSKMGEVPDNVRMEMLEKEKQAREALRIAIEERLKK
ncbi:pre-toxin TG domain-containing protein [Rossellomorea marisflavi]|uniref:pre-toxin TG domain-containing protein n=1 Tax=Rossellomorea marisflavi TaxID=189381 RepID=UPI0011E878E1|nr:pre-toxin TG domain-containing protein [Rossellomorea marisflavi]MCM2590909.1 pre-toxin TG domain-containing protein [Rossellomorea marisflavi]TYO74378.1 hypothetical protein DQ398_000533 [Rossellomorea marisflavi]